MKNIWAVVCSLRKSLNWKEHPYHGITTTKYAWTPHIHHDAPVLSKSAAAVTHASFSTPLK